MKISILLPYKENFSPQYLELYPYLFETTEIVNLKDVTVFGSTDFTRKFNLKYKNLPYIKIRL